MKILTVIALILGFIMTVLNLYPSWSEHHSMPEEKMLTTFMLCVSFAYIIRSLKAVNRNYLAYKKLRVSNFDFTTAVLFGCILIFPVTTDFNLHYIFTALAIITAYLGFALSQTEKIMKISAWSFMGIGAVLFLGGLLLRWYTTGTAELLVSIAIAIHLFNSKLV